MNALICESLVCSYSQCRFRAMTHIVFLSAQGCFLLAGSYTSLQILEDSGVWSQIPCKSCGSVALCTLSVPSASSSRYRSAHSSAACFDSGWYIIYRPVPSMLSRISYLLNCQLCLFCGQNANPLWLHHRLALMLLPCA